MKASELRIGNWVSGNSDPYMQVHSLWKDEIDLIIEEAVWEYEGHEINPIPLNEEWLLRFGFDISESWYNLYWTVKPKGHREYRDCLGINLQEGRTVLSSNGGIHEAMNVYVNHCEYVHQLQNLYFALTKTELEIK